jgi:hypothetical protein
MATTDDMCLAEFSESHVFLQLPGSLYPNMNLLLQGCLSAAPTRVSFAISLRTLELYRWLRVRQPRLSIQAFVRSLCDYHNVSIFHPCLPAFCFSSNMLTDTILRWVLAVLLRHV